MYLQHWMGEMHRLIEIKWNCRQHAGRCSRVSKWLCNCIAYHYRYDLWYGLLHIYGQISHFIWCRSFVSSFLQCSLGFMTFFCWAAVSLFYSCMKQLMRRFFWILKVNKFILTDLLLVFRLHEHHLLFLPCLSLWFFSTLKTKYKFYFAWVFKVRMSVISEQSNITDWMYAHTEHFS